MEWLLVGLALAAWGWYSGTQAKEAAVRAARRACKRHNQQLLDETVALEGVKLRRDGSGRVRLLRHYGFDFTDDAEHRYHGRLTLLGHHLMATQMEGGGPVVIENEKET